MPDEGTNADPLGMLMKSTGDLLRPEELVREATRDIVKAEIRRHIEKTLHDDPKLAKDLRDAVRSLLEARALEYAALVRVGACTARLGISALPDEMRKSLTKDLLDVLAREIGQIVDRSL
ncbi:MAG: hypothetical protein AAFA34_00535 [Thermoplasmata archaeon]